ncbi:MAG: hypothetical protein JW821_18280 [Deltaproteobacteria bacterium]|nr:hypothetical protein [Deltaproteobacteria bacterium]
MKEAKEVTVTIKDRAFNVGISLQDLDLIEVLFDALSNYVMKGSPIRIMQTYGESLSESTRIITKIISRLPQMVEWRDETRQLITILQKGK